MDGNTNARFLQLLESSTETPASLRPFADNLSSCDAADLTAVLRELRALLSQQKLSPEANWWPELFAILQMWLARATSDSSCHVEATVGDEIAALYAQLTEKCTQRFRLLEWLAFAGEAGNLSALAKALCDDPPTSADAAAAAFVPLMQPHSNAALLFPTLAQCLDHPLLAAPVLDLANYLTRNGITQRHPLAGQTRQLVRTLAGLTSQLEQLQTNREQSLDDSVRSRALSGVALGVALCDALALIGDPSARGALSHALSLQHRRLRIEAAAALVRLGDEQGRDALIACAADPVMRLRALRYAEELDLEQEIDEAHQSPLAVAESQLVTYLSEPTVMGVPPSSCELVDSRTMYWPGYEEPRMCFLFRFVYRAIVGDESVSISNIGIAGPVVHAFKADLGNLSIDDIYAAYAGWQAEHPEITQFAVSPASPLRSAALALVERLEQDGFDRVQPVLLGRFFRDDVIAAAAEKNGIAGAAVADADVILWYPAQTTSRPITPAEAYCIYKGRRLLRQFN
jgi:hypothetical protein